MKKTGLSSAMALMLSFVLSAVAYADKPKKPKPHQVPQTGVEDAAPLTATDLAGEVSLEQMTSRSAEGLVEVQHPDGTVSIDLQGRFMSVMLANEGAPIASCHTGREALNKAKAAPKHGKGKRAQRPAPVTTSTLELK